MDFRVNLGKPPAGRPDRKSSEITSGWVQSFVKAHIKPNGRGTREAGGEDKHEANTGKKDSAQVADGAPY
jgi:hypothetical protein